jgi:hypothetical protein
VPFFSFAPPLLGCGLPFHPLAPPESLASKDTPLFSCNQRSDPFAPRIPGPYFAVFPGSSVFSRSLIFVCRASPETCQAESHLMLERRRFFVLPPHATYNTAPLAIACLSRAILQHTSRAKVFSFQSLCDTLAHANTNHNRALFPLAHPLLHKGAPQKTQLQSTPPRLTPVGAVPLLTATCCPRARRARLLSTLRTRACATFGALSLLSHLCFIPLRERAPAQTPSPFSPTSKPTNSGGTPQRGTRTIPPPFVRAFTT